MASRVVVVIATSVIACVGCKSGDKKPAPAAGSGSSAPAIDAASGSGSGSAAGSGAAAKKPGKPTAKPQPLTADQKAARKKFWAAMSRGRKATVAEDYETAIAAFGE